ncbi:site-specific integrase [Arcicella sp. LKC2W]|uniref:site-specific integrase n=1 Tax=Arcicella sp. LKC2W TaxID=2984198 RepID=UPI002B1FCFF7|nr:site-specific integrase [Arcicella sp. LKC2W]MEA5457931.1 site-specific integrase [Arcicella sp. LKC2W]
MVTKFADFSLRFDRKGQLDANDKESTGLIEIRMYYNGKASYKSTGYRITQDQWNKKKNAPKDALMNRNIQTMISEYQTFESEFRAIHKTFSIEDLKRKDQPVPEPPQKKTSFTDFFREQLDIEKPLKQPSLRTRRLTFDYFKEFRSEVSFDEINNDLIKAFNSFLHEKRKKNGKPLNLNTIAKHHKHVRKYILEAIKSRHIAIIDNPYLHIKIPKQDSESNYLTEEELQRFEELTFSESELLLERSRDMFLIACYTGLRFSDVYKINPTHLYNTLEGLELNYQAGKTQKFGQKFLYLLFGGKPQQIARKYINSENKALFKGLTNPKVNLQLKIIAKRANVQKATKFKDSRNTFANIMSTKVPITVVQDEMQHSLLSTTQGYLKRNPEFKKKALAKIKWE